MTDEQRVEIGGMVLRMYGAMGGAVTVVRVEARTTGRTIYSKSHQFTTSAEQDFARLKGTLTAGL
jgi:hypothetical protein